MHSTALQDWRSASCLLRNLTTSADPLPLSVMGTHGGAGTTTVARLLGATDVGRRWPERTEPQLVLLTARTNARGLASASQSLAGYHAAEHPDGPYLAGFVMVPDAPGRLPKALKRRILILASATMVYRLPWVAVWRLKDTEEIPAVESDLRRFADQVIDAHPMEAR
jgi:hypothetical protein